MIIGIAGTIGAGKGALVEHLKTKGFKHYSAREFITKEIERRGMPVDRDSMIVVANDLRTAFGPSYIVDSLYERARAAGGDAILESLRALAEVERVKELGGAVLGVDAPTKLRYERSVKRGSETDHISYEKFLAQEQTESNESDPTKQNIFGALKEADVVLSNNGTLEELYVQVDAALERLVQEGAS